MSDIIYYDNEVVGLEVVMNEVESEVCLLYTSPSPRD